MKVKSEPLQSVSEQKQGVGGKPTIVKAPRIPRKKGQPAGSKKHSDLYTDENPKGTIHGLGFKNPAKARQSVSKLKTVVVVMLTKHKRNSNGTKSR